MTHLSRKCGMLAAVSCVLTVLLGFGAGVPAADDGMFSLEDLEGTVWYSHTPHTRVDVTPTGEVNTVEAKETYIHFTRLIDGVLVAEWRWWVPSQGVNVVEYALFAFAEPNVLSYIDADPLRSEDQSAVFPGIVGEGTMEFVSNDKARLVQLGFLADGSASGFTATLRKVDEVPDVPIEQTFPPLPEDGN